ncbi:MAG TPA: vitamin K epoxide reductase family protein [Streptosporangiaceae bacterium]|nr:vitamin K epoxide reductase family protein [Streptosporangiaceae bacterium]
MTASKSSRARAARAAARASAAKDAASGGTAVKNGTAVKDRDRTQARPSQAPSAQARAGQARAGQARAGQARTVAAGRGSRTPLVEDDPGDRGPAPWMQLTTFVLALGGLGVSIYLTIAHFTESALAGCSESGLVNCAKVTTSPQSYVFGIPVAVLGLAFFVFVAAIMSPWAWQARRREVHMLRLASMVVGIGMVIYLVYAEFIIIGSICLYCTSVHIITFLLFVLTAFGAAVWGVKPGAPWGPFGRRDSEAEAVSA